MSGTVMLVQDVINANFKTVIRHTCYTRSYEAQQSHASH